MSGGTDCAAPLARLNQERARVDLVLLVSGNQPWLGFQNAAGGT